jgi:3-oxoacyl-[acyl-carrier-protein] synthase II
MKRRVVVTGIAGISPLGNDWAGIRAHLGSYRNAVVNMAEWGDYEGLNTRLGAPAAEFSLSERYNRKSTRSMGRVALLATRASELALLDAGLLDDPLVKSGALGISYGSCAGTTNAIGDFGKMIEERSTKGINATTYIKMMAHTAPVNLGVFLGVTGRVITTSSALYFGQPGYRLCLRGDTKRPPDGNDCRRCRRVVRKRSSGIRYLVCDQRAQ